MKKTTLSIIIVNFNTKKLTLDAIGSVKNSVIKESYEIILVDNNSTDGSVEEFKKLEKTKKIKLIKNKKNEGFSKAVNIGIRKAKGEYILLLNSDTKVKKNTINKLIKYAKNNKNVGAVAPKLLNPDGSLQNSIYNFPTISNALKEFWFGEKYSYEKYAPKGNNPTQVDAIVMTAFLITPIGLKKVGLLNERYFMYFEDIDYCRKLHKKNLKVVYLPKSKVIHHHGASGKKLATHKDQWKRLIPSSKIYHGLVKHYIINAIIWSGQKWQKLFKNE